MKAAEITVANLIREALTIPDGCHREVHVEKNGEVTFTAPLTSNSRVASDNEPTRHLDTYIGDLHSITIDDFQWLHQRSDGQIEFLLLNGNDDFNGTKKIPGEYHPHVQIITPEDAATVITAQLSDDNEFQRLINAIKERQK